jgi:hypothetical protein
MSEYQVKLEAVGEYQDALRYKMISEELCNTLLGLLGQLSRQCAKNGMEMPEEVSRIMEKTSEALDARVGSSGPRRLPEYIG